MKKKSTKKNQKESSRVFLTEKEVEVITKQIRFNSEAIDRIIKVIDLLVNKEKCPKDANTLAALRQRLQISIDESDTFRKVLWRHKKWMAGHYEEGLDAASFLVGQIRSRKQALIAQLAMK